MKLNYSINDIAQIVQGEIISNKSCVISSPIETVSYDSRKIIYPSNTLFFALIGDFRDGHQFIEEAYQKGVKYFCVSKKPVSAHFPDACFIIVKNTLESLQELASFHRLKFQIPVIAVTGSVGKTSVKEWLYTLIHCDLQVVKSPKSYNSQLGVALSLLEIQAHHQIAIIECGISKPGEMKILAEMVKPTIGVFTSFGSAHEKNFKDKTEHLNEKLNLFTNCSTVFFNTKIKLPKKDSKFIPVEIKKYSSFFNGIESFSSHQKENASICIALAQYLKISEYKIKENIAHLPRLALRMELIEGKNNTLLINDTYNADLDALNSSLEYLHSFKNFKDKSLVLGIDNIKENVLKEIKKSIGKYEFKQLFFVQNEEFPSTQLFKNEVILAKGSRKSHVEKWISLMQEKKHQTYIEIDLRILKNNLLFWKSLIKKDDLLLVMVKASAYGTGAVKTAQFLQNNGVNYLGVAYAQEGIELRKNDIHLPILVMNADENDFHHLIEYQLEPSVFSQTFLEKFIHFLIQQQVENYPIHLKFDTGMKRLGFEISEMNEVLDSVLSQPEVKIRSIYSHLADSDNFENDDFTKHQIILFNKIVKEFESKIPYPFFNHIANSEAIYKSEELNTNMVRLGIGLYGMTQNKKLSSSIKEVLSWKSSVSQIKKIKKGESIGYGRSFIAKTDISIAIIPVGYADGFRRSLSNGRGGVFIQNQYCAVLGKVCMDMIMVDVSAINCTENEEVEIIGKNQSLNELSKKMDTIPYETLSTLSSRLNRIYIED
ncbi:MAG: alanine racemase [Flavobacteriia bacterium]|nr:alanine racemase [Flavobacteriia bacterium]